LILFQYVRFYKISIPYRYRDILAISYRYRIEFQNQYRCITNINNTIKFILGWHWRATAWRCKSSPVEWTSLTGNPARDSAIACRRSLQMPQATQAREISSMSWSSIDLALRPKSTWDHNCTVYMSIVLEMTLSNATLYCYVGHLMVHFISLSHHDVFTTSNISSVCLSML